MAGAARRGRTRAARGFSDAVRAAAPQTRPEDIPANTAPPVTTRHAVAVLGVTARVPADCRPGAAAGDPRCTPRPVGRAPPVCTDVGISPRDTLSAEVAVSTCGQLTLEVMAAANAAQTARAINPRERETEVPTMRNRDRRTRA